MQPDAHSRSVVTCLCYRLAFLSPWPLLRGAQASIGAGRE